MAADINTLLVKQAFSGVNYLESLAETPGKSPFETTLLGPTDQGNLQHNVSSIMNKFTVFQYAALNAGASYRAEGHFIGFTKDVKQKSGEEYTADSQFNTLSRIVSLENARTSAKLRGKNDLVKEIEARIKFYEKGEDAVTKSARNFKNISTDILSNPTANRLIEWGSKVSAATNVGFQPYSHTDFMYCKYYGKIPNNRLITLRRFPFPIGDSLRLGGERRNAIPVAQAVTWFGGETSNTLNSLGVFNWDIPWESINAVDGATGQTIEGNEITLNELLKLVSTMNGGTQIASAITAAYVGTVGTDAQMSESSGYEAKIQQYQKNLYDQTSGPYWNRIYGPVNVITQSSRRKRGIQAGWDANPISLKFHYVFRSFNGMSPKIAALDIISNFMNLTYQDAQFLGQLARYFPKTGVKFDPTTTEAIGNILTSWGTTSAGNNSAEFGTLFANIIGAVKLAGSKIVSDPLGVGQKVLQAGLMRPDLLGNAIPDLISIKSALSDRPVGEWHIVVGNPMNPIFVMGDLLCSDVKMAWDDEIGPDDFPTGVTFTVTMKQGKPRDKTAIERMLNHGQTKLTAGALRTSSVDDTFGEQNNTVWDQLTGTETTPGKLADIYAGLTGSKQKAYQSFRDRFLKGYGFDAVGGSFTAAGDKSNLDDSLLLLYYQRQYGNN
jgi:hypothetical protein